jgi:recombination protein RecA
LEIRRTETIEKADSDAVGNRVRVKVVKNKVSPPFRKVELDIIFGKGISASGSLLDAATKYDVIAKRGAYYSYNGERIGQGRDNVKTYLEENPERAKEIEEKLRQIMFNGPDASTHMAIVADESDESEAPLDDEGI